MNWNNVLNERRQSLSPWYKTKEKPMREWRLERVSITLVILFWGIARLIFEHTTGCVPYATAAGRKREANASAIFFPPAKRTVAPKGRLLNRAAEICVQYGLGAVSRLRSEMPMRIPWTKSNLRRCWSFPIHWANLPLRMSKWMVRLSASCGPAKEVFLHMVLTD